MNKVRVDKWLWSVRIFKSRSMASDACRTNKIKIGETILKPSYSLEGGEELIVRKDGFNFVYRVVTLIDKRVSAVLAQPCYENITPAEELNKYQSWFTGKATPERRDKGQGRPTKKERREIEEFKDIEELTDLDY